MRLLDLFCGAGGACAGYMIAGFDVDGVDKVNQPNYPGTFYQGDAIDYVLSHHHDYDVIHASPPCQRYSVTGNMYDNSDYPDMLDEVRNILVKIGKPYVIENVPGSPMKNYITLTGDMFGLRVLRMRYFESNILLLAPNRPKKRGYTSGKGKKYSSFDDGYYVTVAGHNYRFRDGAEAMGINWMTMPELSEAIPPAYTRFIGKQIKRYIEVSNGCG